jgi:exonuclease-1
VDAYGWLHRGTVACAIDLALEKPTTKFVDFAMHRVRMLLHFGITPYIVFDGDYLPSKAATEHEREQRRAEAKRVGLDLYRMGKATLAQAELQKAVDVSPEMARQFIEELKKINVKYVVAPYEADAQLVYLEKKGLIQGIISEDSDMLVFGAQRLLTKLDQYGECIEINRADFTACKEISLVGWTDTEFRRMAILSGCDYLASINKMGLKTAYRLVRKHKDIEKILRMLAFDSQFTIPPDYLENFRKAELTFLHQRVYCPEKEEVVMATELGTTPAPKDFAFIGKDVEKEIAMGVANGDLNPMTKEPISFQALPSSGPKRTWPSTRRQSIATPIELKPKKPITDFFKRTPLAELDPNSFTPSPSQRRILEQNSGVVISTPVDQNRSPLYFSSAPPPCHTGSSSSTRRRHGLSSTTSSLLNPPKRQRLCDDAEDEAIPVLGKSPFFSSKLPDPSPSLSRNKRKGKESKINIWSDDSIEEVLAELPELSQVCVSTRPTRIPVFAESQSKTSQAPTVESIFSQSFGAASDDTQFTGTSTQSREGGELPQLSEKHMTAEFRAIAEAYSCKPTSSAKVSTQPKPTTPLVSNAPQIFSNPPLFRQQSMTPLQRLQASTLRRTQPFDIDSTGRKEKSNAVTFDPILNEIASAARQTQFIEPLVTKLMGGSEDFLIPDSEDEGEAFSDLDVVDIPKIDLSRFIFNP